MASIAQYYELDHDRLDGLFKRFRALKVSDFAQAKARFFEFQAGLLRHIVWEEEILFPAFEDKTGMKDTGPTEVMRIEHRQIKQLLVAIDQRLQEQAATDTQEAALIETLGAHNRKEESILYPAIDSQLTDQERKDVFARMEHVRQGEDRKVSDAIVNP